jgi:hypothetical protein
MTFYLQKQMQEEEDALSFERNAEAFLGFYFGFFLELKHKAQEVWRS